MFPMTGGVGELIPGRHKQGSLILNAGGSKVLHNPRYSWEASQAPFKIFCVFFCIAVEGEGETSFVHSVTKGL